MNAKIENDGAACGLADEIVSLANSRTKLLAEMEAELQAVRARYAPTLERVEASIASSTKTLKGYCSRKAVAARLFATSRFTDSKVARFGWRDSAPTVKPLDTSKKQEEVAAELHAQGFRQYVIIPEAKPALDKPAIMAAGLNAGQLANLGLRVAITSTFYCEPLDAVITRAATSKAEKPAPAPQA